MSEKNLKKSKWIYFYWLILASFIVAEHWYIYPVWRRRELPRRTLGIATVMGLAWPLAESGHLDRDTWWALFCGFGIAGAITATGHIIRDVLEAKQLRGEMTTDGEAKEILASWERRIGSPK